MQTGLIIELVSPYWVLNNQNIRCRGLYGPQDCVAVTTSRTGSVRMKIFYSSESSPDISSSPSVKLTHCMRFYPIYFMAVYNMTPYMLVSIRELLGFDSMLTPPILVPGRDLV